MRSIRRLRRPDRTSDLTDIPLGALPLDERARIGDEALHKRLRSTVHPRFYAAQVDDPDLATDVDGALAHFLRHGLEAGARVSALFNPECYLDRLAARGMELPAGAHPFLHWVTVGWAERIIPTVLFDEDYYVARHRDLRRGPEWAFAQYLRAGCYVPSRWPGPFGPNYGGPVAPDARERQDPPLVTGMRHRADEYDLGRTSWLEEGVAAGQAKLDALGSDRMRELVAKAAAIEPLVLQPKRERWVSWPPHTHPMLLPTARVEEVRRSLGVTRADSVLVIPGTGSQQPGRALGIVTRALATLNPGESTLVVTTEGSEPPDGLAPGARVADLSAPLAALTDRQRLLGLLDVVRGVRPRRVVVADSALGWELLTTYGRSLRNEMSLGACLSEWSLDEDGDRVGFAIREFQVCFDLLDWVVTDTAALRQDLVDRYLLTASARQRLLSADDSDEPSLAAVLGQAVRA